MRNSIAVLCLLAVATAASAFPTTVKLLKDPDFVSSDGTQVRVVTNKGVVVILYGNPAYDDFRKASKGQCYVLETNTESNVLFNKKVDQSKVSEATRVRCP